MVVFQRVNQADAFGVTFDADDITGLYRHIDLAVAGDLRMGA